MVDIMQVQTSRTSSSYAGKISGYDPKVRWSDEELEQIRAKLAPEEFLTQIKEKLAQKGDALVKECANAQPRKELSAEDISALAAKYNPTKMSQNEYDSFLDELVDKEVLRKDELGQLGYHGLVNVTFNCGAYSVDARTLSASPYSRYGIYGSAAALTDTDGNALALAKLASLWQPRAGSAAFFAAAERKISAFDAMGAILEAMQVQRER